MSWVASITAGDSRIRPPILLPMLRETFRLTSAESEQQMLRLEIGSTYDVNIRQAGGGGPAGVDAGELMLGDGTGGPLAKLEAAETELGAAKQE